jgi:hypothetical protein
VNDAFRIDVDAGSVEVVLIAASALGQTSAPAGWRQAFSLVFRGQPAPVLPQRTYAFMHPRLGGFDLFIVPIGPDREGMRYEAVFG